MCEKTRVLLVVGLVVFSLGVLTPILPIYLAARQMGAQTIGLLFSTQMVALALGEMTWGGIIDGLGPKVVMITGSFLAAMLMLIFPYVGSTVIFMVLFFLLGVSRAAIFVTGRWYLAVHSQASKRTRSMALFAVIFSGTTGVASIAGGLMADGWGYPAMFLVAAVSPILSGLLSLVGIKRLAPEEREKNASGRVRKVSRRPMSRRALLKLVGMQGIVVALQFTGISIFRTYIPLMATDVLGTGATGASVFFAIQGFVDVTATIPLAGLADRKGKKRYMMLGLLGSIVAYVGMAFASDYWMLVVSVFSFSISAALFGPAALALFSESVPRERQATGMGMYGVSEDAGLIAGAALGGVVWGAWGHQATFLIGSLMAAIGSFLCYRVVHEPDNPDRLLDHAQGAVRSTP